MTDTTDTELAWAAGFFDGEGCIHYNEKETKGIDISLMQATKIPGVIPQTLLRFRDAIGYGNISLRIIAKERKSEVWGLWLTSYHKVSEVMLKLWPFLSDVKKHQASECFRKFGVPYRLPDICRRGHPRTPEITNRHGACKICSGISRSLRLSA